MSEMYNKAGGLDIHNKFVIGTILGIDGSKIQRRFDRTIEGILSLREWITENDCPVVACESTNAFWYPINDCLSSITKFIVGNAYDMKVMSHKKTDKIDSEMIAKLALKDMVPSSHIATPQQRDFRNLMRYRHFLVSKATDLKNRMHAIFQAELFHLSSVITDPFGVTGHAIIKGITDGMTTEEILANIPEYVLKKKEEQLTEVLTHKISIASLQQLKSSTEMLDQLQLQIKEITKIARDCVRSLFPRGFQILCSIPGVGEITAMTLLSEVGDFHDFASGDKLAAWVGLVPKVYQSADHNVRCGITRRGTKYVRWVMVQAAHASTRQKMSRFRNFYEGKKERLGHGKTIVALARKMLTIAWHLIIRDEFYEEEGETIKISPKSVRSIKVPLTISLEEVIELFVNAKKSMEVKIDDPPK